MKYLDGQNIESTVKYRMQEEITSCRYYHSEQMNNYISVFYNAKEVSVLTLRELTNRPIEVTIRRKIEAYRMFI